MGTALANDEVKDGRSERGNFVKQNYEQWSMRITAYAERLLSGLDTVQWSDSIKEIQRNWIGKSEGASLDFSLEKHPQKIEVFTTRPDTIFGVTFIVLAPEHELVNIITTQGQMQEVENYCQQTALKSERDRQSDVKSITGAFTGAYALNPFNGEKIPIWIGDYVLAYGTGAAWLFLVATKEIGILLLIFCIEIKNILRIQTLAKEPMTISQQL